MRPIVFIIIIKLYKMSPIWSTLRNAIENVSEKKPPLVYKKLCIHIKNQIIDEKKNLYSFTINRTFNIL